MTESAAIPLSTRLRTPLLPAAAAAGFAMALVAVGVIAWFSYESQRATGELRARVTHTVSVVDGLQRLQGMLVDAETGQRGYLITGEEAYLEPYTAAQMALPGALSTVRALISDDAAQVARFDDVAGAATQRAELLEQTIALRRSGDAAGAADLIRLGRGKALMDRIRAGVGEMLAFERARLQTLQAERDVAAAWSLQVTLVGSAILLLLVAAAAVMTSRAFRQRESEAWIRSGQAGLATLLQGELRAEFLGERVLSYLAQLLAAPVGAFYILDEGGNLRRVAGYGLSQDPAPPMPEATTGLPAQASRDRRILYFENVPADHLPVVSGLGKSQPRTVAVMPALVDGEVMGVVEIGLFDGLAARERELLVRLSEPVAIAIRTAKDRTRLEELLAETQRQSEELQAQQEELRVNNEELEEQSQALKESQARLEMQQAELEQTNTYLEEHAEKMRLQSDHLARAQATLADKADDAGARERVQERVPGEHEP